LIAEPSNSIAITGETDRVYMDTKADVVLSGIKPDAGPVAGAALDPAKPTFTSITVHRTAALRPAPPALSGAVEACPLDLVLWNAWAERCKTIADFGPDDWRHYVCIEPARVSPATAGHHAHAALTPGHVWTLTQRVTLHYA
jgi:hypothetical protein